MRRTFLIFMLVGLVLSACGGQSGDAPPSSSADTTSSTASAGPGSTSAPESPATSSTTDETTGTTSGRPVAPDFTLALGNGGSYTLSDGAKPVYLVFWAEW